MGVYVWRLSIAWAKEQRTAHPEPNTSQQPKSQLVRVSEGQFGGDLGYLFSRCYD